MSSFIQELKTIIKQKHLLDHPFYQAWSKGTLPIEVMQRYAEQYYHLEKNFPLFLSALHANAGDDFRARQLITENLHDEEFGPENHRELWLRYAEAIGTPREGVENSEMLPETKDAIDTFRSLSDTSLLAGVAGLAAYDSQIPEVAETKIDGLKEHYGIDSERALKFFELHGEVDIKHSQAWWDIIEEHAHTDEQKEHVRDAVTKGRDALWNFLSGIVHTHMPALAAEC